MSEALSADEEKRFAVIIDKILATADLQTVSAKSIRRDIQKVVPNEDLSSKKAALNALISVRFDNYSANHGADDHEEPAKNGAPPSPPPHKNGANGTSKKRASPDLEEDDVLSSVGASPAPAPKRTKIGKEKAETDEEYARRLQAELNRVTGRSTRGGGPLKRKAVVKKSPKKKSKARVGSEDDSDAEGSEKKEVKRTGGFHKELGLSDQLAGLIGATRCSRPQTVKKIWEYIKANDLQDPNDKRQIICDDAMRSVFKTDKVHMFTMNKIINTHLYDITETTANAI